MSRSRALVTFAAWLLACAPALAAPVRDVQLGPPEERRLDVFYTGFTGGLSSARLDFAELRPLYQPDPGRDFEAGGFVADNVFRQGRRMIYTDNGPLTLADFQSFFNHGPIQTKPLGRAPLLVSDYVFGLASGDWAVDWLADRLKKQGGFPDVRRDTGWRYRLTNADGLSLMLLSLEEKAPPESLWDDLTHWEMVPSGSVALRRDGRRTTLLAIGRPLGDGLRRSRLLLDLRREAPPGALTIDVGNLLDPGFSTLSKEQREFTLQRLGDLGYNAVVPAETELALDEAEWNRLRALVPLLAANLTPRDETRAPLPGHLIVQRGGLKVALIGLVDDKALELRGAVGPLSAWKASEAVPTAAAEVARLAEEQPDIVLILTNVRDARMSELRQLLGVTAVLADFDGLPGDVFTEQVDVRGAQRIRSSQTFLVAKSSPNRVGRFQAVYDSPPRQRSRMRALRNEAYLVTDALPQDDGWRWQLNATLDRYQSARRAFLLPDLREAAAALPGAEILPAGKSPLFDRKLWTRFMANLLKQTTCTEVMITRELPVVRPPIGPVPQLALEAWLDVGDRLVSTSLTGKQLKALAAADAGAHLLTFSGLDLANNKVSGFPLGDDELYRVTTTDAVARHALYQGVFSGRPQVEGWEVPANGRTHPVNGGRTLPLRELALYALKALKMRHGDAFTPKYLDAYAHLLEPESADTRHLGERWVFQMDDGQLLLNGYQNTGNAAYDQVRNTRVTSPNSFALGGKGRLSGLYESRDWAWENRAKAVYKRTTLRNRDGSEVSQDAEDEVVLTSELRLKFLKPTFLTAWTPTPFVNTNYTTEFVPDTANGVQKPRRQELNGIAGLVLYPGLGFKEARGGIVIKNDLARPGYLEPGLQAAAGFEHKLDPLPATLKAGLDAVHYLPTATDGLDRLGWQADFNAGITVPLWERFTLNLAADYFVYRGKLEATSNWGSSLDFKVGLGYSLAFKPFYGVWY
jgi:hypothetical protein